jgi:5-methylcytosine-specific restriction endonuclease McrA
MELQQRWSKDYAEWSRHECKHERQELRRGTNNGGAPVIRMQCIDCGLRIGQAVKRPSNADELPEFDDAKHDAYNAARKAALSTVDQKKYVEIQLRRWKGKEDGDSYYTQAHNAYLDSPAWKDRRRLVMERAQGLCEGCRQASATEVHHLSYSHWGQELLFELVALCGDCHDRIHAKGDHEALIEGCKTCLHASKGSYCLLFDMPMPMALDVEGPCTFERDGFEPAD